MGTDDMGTTAFVGYRMNGKVQGFELSGDGMYENTGLNVLTKYRSLTKDELISFFTEKVRFDMQNPEEDNEEYLWNAYRIWELDWKQDTIDVEEADDYTKKVLTREYGYVFDLDQDVVEIYEQGETVEEESKLTYLLHRDNTDAIEKAFQPEIKDAHGLNDEELFQYRQRFNENK